MVAVRDLIFTDHLARLEPQVQNVVFERVVNVVAAHRFQISVQDFPRFLVLMINTCILECKIATPEVIFRLISDMTIYPIEPICQYFFIFFKFFI